MKCAMLGCAQPAKGHKGLCDTHVARVLLVATNPLTWRSKAEREGKA